MSTPRRASRGNVPGTDTARAHAAASKPRRVPLFAARAPREVHARLVAAAKADGLTIADELTRLLDLRQRVEEASRPAHPLSRPVPVQAVSPDLRLVQGNSATGTTANPSRPESPPGHGISANPPQQPKSPPGHGFPGTPLNPATWLPYPPTPPTEEQMT